MFALFEVVRGFIASRLPAAVLASTVFAVGVLVFGVSVVTAVGATHILSLLSVPLLALPAFVFGLGWAFTAPSLVQVWVRLGGGGVLLWFAAAIVVRVAA